MKKIKIPSNRQAIDPDGAYITTADQVLPVSFRVNPEDGFKYEVKRPTHSVVMVTTPRGNRYFIKGDECLLEDILKRKEINFRDNWSRFYPVYGSDAWATEQMMRESQERWGY
jgi:hypothetical protein